MADLNEKLGYKGDDKIKLTFEGPSDETDVEDQINIIDAVLGENPDVLAFLQLTWIPVRLSLKQQKKMEFR